MARIRAHVDGAARAARRFQAVADDLPGAALTEQLRFAEEEAIPALRKHAPRRTNRLANQMRASVARDRGEVLVRDDARAADPSSRRYPYLQTTRAGHLGIIATKSYRKLHLGEALTPRSRAYWQRKLAGGGRPHALRFTINGKVLFRFYTKGFHPKRTGRGDWVERAMPDVESRAQTMATRLGRRIATRFVGA